MTRAEKLSALRAALAAQGVDGFLVPRSDEYLGEYVPPSGERLAWLTGFTGSAGIAIVLADRAALFIDGRYTTQAALQTDPALWERRHLIDEPPARWLGEHAAGKRIGYDPWLHAEGELNRLSEAGVQLVPLDANPLDGIWADRPAPPTASAYPQPIAFAGQESLAKREAIAAQLRAAGQEAVVLADPHSVAWLLNLRGGDLAHTPLALGFALLRYDGSVDLIMEAEKLTPETRMHLGNAVVVQGRETLPALLETFAGRTVRLDPDNTPAWFAARLREAGATVAKAEDPVRLPRAKKNEAERAGFRAAHKRDAVAMARFLHWFQNEAPKGGLTEVSVADQLLAFRAMAPEFRAESFPAIAGAGENGAIVHYRATPESHRAVKPDECFLIDSGAQYEDGTTDITRTLWTGPGAPPAALKRHYTLVLMGHVALARQNFPEGVCGAHLDAIARAPLWREGLDYDHGTGHGVGSVLSVHEGPVSISRAAKPVPLAEGMVLSDEPGYYREGAYGIRIENLLLVQPAEPAGERRKFLGFETLTLAPYDRRLIDLDLLDGPSRAWIDAYQARVLEEVGPLLEPVVAAWLRAACAPL
ncbi:aminopeptidase P family protein [Acetobacteraceae bacterium H6797]|nr:aminopeptidase P family protein [Acetobacteraceae bacterium H6797]